MDSERAISQQGKGYYVASTETYTANLFSNTILTLTMFYASIFSNAMFSSNCFSCYLEHICDEHVHYLKYIVLPITARVYGFHQGLFRFSRCMMYRVFLNR